MTHSELKQLFDIDIIFFKLPAHFWIDMMGLKLSSCHSCAVGICDVSFHHTVTPFFVKATYYWLKTGITGQDKAFKQGEKSL